jgi:uncharacterized protein
MPPSPPFRSLVAVVAACVASLVGQPAAWAKFVPPPLNDTHVVTMVGWLAPYDLRKYDEESQIIEAQTGVVVDVLLATNDDPIDEVTSETFKAWQPGDPKKNNGVLLVMQPNFPRGERKVRIQAGAGVRLSEADAKDIMKNVIGPLINGTDQVRTAVGAGLLALAKALGADEEKVRAGIADAGSDAGGQAVVISQPALPAPPPQPSDDDPAGVLWKVLGGLVVAVGAYVGLMWLRSRASDGPPKGP